MHQGIDLSLVEWKLLRALSPGSSNKRIASNLEKSEVAKADLLVGKDVVFCATTLDRMRWQIVGATVDSHKAANDESIHTWRTAA